MALFHTPLICICINISEIHFFEVYSMNFIAPTALLLNMKSTRSGRGFSPGSEIHQASATNPSSSDKFRALSSFLDNNIIIDITYIYSMVGSV